MSLNSQPIVHPVQVRTVLEARAARPAEDGKLNRLGKIFLTFGTLLLVWTLGSLVTQRLEVSSALADLDARTRMIQPAEESKVALSGVGEPPEAGDLGFLQQQPAKRRVAAGDLLGRIRIPARKVDAPIRYGASDRILKSAAGLVPGTALPGSGAGNSVISAHRDSLFSNLRHARVDDTIEIESIESDGTLLLHRFRIISMEVVDETEISVLDPTPTEVVTLLTCYPFDYVGAATSRLVVRASRVL